MSSAPTRFLSWRGLTLRIVLLFVLLLVVAVRLLYASHGRRQSAPAIAAPADHTRILAGDSSLQAKTVTREFGRKIFRLPKTAESPGAAPAGPPPLPDEVKRALLTAPGPISLFSGAKLLLPENPAVPATYYLPSYRLIRCMLITSPQTGDIETPLIGIVLDDQYNLDADGCARIVIPAGVEVHAMGRPAPVRDRIDGDGTWTLVWRTGDENNATELTLPALALNRDYDEATRSYGDQEKSPGIVGRRFQSFSETVIKEALLDAAAATIRAMKSTTAQTNALTNQVTYVPKPGWRNAAAEGAAAGTDRVTLMLDDIRRQIDEKGYYVAVLPGKQFYLYNKTPIDLRLARRPTPRPTDPDRTTAAVPPDPAGPRA